MSFSKIPTIRGKSEIAPLLTYLTDHVQDSAFVCGGYVRWMCSPHYKPAVPRDVDVYCKDEKTYDELYKLFDTLDMPKRENPISAEFRVTTRDYTHRFFGLPPIQLIKPIKSGSVVTKGELEEILNSFDFTVIRIGLVSIDQALADDDFYEHEKKKKLVIKNIHCPISSSFRFMKYYKKGYWPKLTEIVKLFMDWDNRDDEYRERIRLLVIKKDKLTKEEIMELEALMRID